MANGMRKVGTFGAGALLALAVGEARNPGSAEQTVESTTNAVTPALYGAGIVVGEGLNASAPVFEGARGAIGGLGLAASEIAPPTEDTLPTTPLAGE